jgi:hypothetical protein
MKPKRHVLGLLALWPLAAWLYMQVGTMHLMLDLQTGDKYCVDGFGFRFDEGGFYSYFRRVVFFACALFIAGLPLALLIQQFRHWHKRRAARTSHEQSKGT